MQNLRRIAVVAGVVASLTLIAAGCGSLTGASGSSQGATRHQTSPSPSSGASGASTTALSSGGSSSSTTGSSSSSASASGSGSAASSGSSAASTDPSTTASASPFPAIIRMAMASLPQSVMAYATAPTVLPTDAAGSLDMYYKPSYSTTPIMGYPGFLSTYSVTLSSPGHPLAAFTDSRFDTSTHAQGAFVQGFGNQQVPSSAPTVDLGSGIMAKEFPNALLGTTEIVWQEGRWTVRVSGTSAPPDSEASAVVAFLHRYFMPVPTTSGGISVDVTPTGTQATVSWTSGSELLLVRAYPGAASPAETALGMAISMRSYK